MPLRTNVLMPVADVENLPEHPSVGDMCFVQGDQQLYICVGREGWLPMAAPEEEPPTLPEIIDEMESKSPKINRIELLFGVEPSE